MFDEAATRSGHFVAKLAYLASGDEQYHRNPYTQSYGLREIIGALGALYDTHVAMPRGDDDHWMYAVDHPILGEIKFFWTIPIDNPSGVSYSIVVASTPCISARTSTGSTWLTVKWTPAAEVDERIRRQVEGNLAFDWASRGRK